MKADEAMIRWLLEESGISRYRIHKDTGIPQTTLERWANGKTEIARMSFENAAALTAYAASQIKEGKTMNYCTAPDGAEYMYKQEPYPSDNGELIHVEGWSKDIHQEDRYLLTFRANPDYRGMEQDPAEWSDWVPVSAEYIGEVDAAITEENDDVMKLDNGDVVRQSTWNGEQWHDNGKEYRPLYSINYDTGDSVIVGVKIS